MIYVDKKKFLRFDDWLIVKAKVLAEDLAKLAVKSIKDAIKEKKLIASGQLIESWTYAVTKKGIYKFLVKVKSESKYWKAMDEGTEKHPHFTPIPTLIEWIKLKAARGAFPEATDEKSIRNLAYAIAVNHSKHGIKARNYRELAINKFNSRKNIIMYNWTQKYASDK